VPAGYTGTKNDRHACEPWPVTYEYHGRICSGQVVGFSEAGWHIVGDTPLAVRSRLALHVHLPHRKEPLRIPLVVVQWVDGLSFVARAGLSRSSAVPAA